MIMSRCDAWVLHNLFKPKGPNRWLRMAKSWDLGSTMAVKLTFWPFWASEWVPLRLKGLQKDRVSHGIALDTPHAHILKRKKNWPKMRYQKLGFGVHNGRKNDFFAVLSLWVGPFRLKRSQKDRASHGIALDTPHAYILKKKNWPKTGPPNLGFGVRNGPKMVKNDPNAYNLHEVKLFDQLLPTFHWF